MSERMSETSLQRSSHDNFEPDLDIHKEKPIIRFDPACIRKRSNWSTMKNEFKIDHPDFHPDFFLKDMPAFSPKLVALLKKIKDLDARDKKKHGTTFKHFIFSDIKSGGQGAKMLAAALVSNGWQMGYKAELKNADKFPKKNISEENDDISSIPSEKENPRKSSTRDTYSKSTPGKTSSTRSSSEKEESSSARTSSTNVSSEKSISELSSQSSGGRGSDDESYSENGPKPNWGPLEMLSHNDLKKTNSFYLLSSVPVYDKPISVRMKKEILATFNSRPENIYGDLARIIVMDSGFKEGIDLFDIKYIHIFEPSLNMADQKQVIGRGTRTCGQKGLEFHPTQGWPLEVFIYDMEIPEKLRFSLLGSETAYELLMRAMNTDIRLANFGYDVERLAVLGSVDYELNENVHQFQIEEEYEDDEQIVFGGSPSSSEKSSQKEEEPIDKEDVELLFQGVMPMGHKEMTKYIQDKFGEYKWEKVKMENLCGDVPDEWKRLSSSSSSSSRKTPTISDISVSSRRSENKEDEDIENDLLTQPGSLKSLSTITGQDVSPISNIRERPISEISTVSEKPLASVVSSIVTKSQSPQSSLRQSEETVVTRTERPSEADTLSVGPSKAETVSVGPSEADTLSVGPSKAETVSVGPSEAETITEIAKRSTGRKSKKTGGASSVLSFTPTQAFIQHYFSPFCPVKGMLLYHSVGTGKTCSAIAAATTNFEPLDYTILWVTRTTLKNDIWKNMFDQVCHKAIQERIANGEVIPDTQKERMRLLSKAWRIRPMSYKQFSNLVSKKNAFYERLVKENGEADPLRKTLLIIDEAHKLYGNSGLSALETPDMEAFHGALMNSYAVSGFDSVRVLLMTATPITENPMELIRLINLCRPIQSQIPDTFERFAEKYLKEDGGFTPEGQIRFLDDIAGHISYLNREKDARQFSQPRVKKVLVPMVADVQMVEDFDKFVSRSEAETDVLKYQADLENLVKKMEEELLVISKIGLQSEFHKICENFPDLPKKKCQTVVNRNITDLMKEVKQHIQTAKERIKSIRSEIATIKKGKQSRLISIQNKIRENPTLFSLYKSSTYAAIRNSCSSKTLTGTKFLEAVQTLPEVVEIDRKVQVAKENIVALESQIKTEVLGFKSKIKQMKAQLKDKNIAPSQRMEIELAIRDNQKEFRKTKKERTMDIRDDIKDEKNEIKELEKLKKLVFKRVRKTLKATESLKKKEEKAAKKQLRKTRKDIQLSELSEEVREIADRRRVLIERDLRDMHEEVEEKAREKREKQLEKEQQNRVRKTLKEREKAEEKERKNLAKQRERDAKKTQKLKEKQEAKTRKNQEKATKAATKKAKK